MNETSTKILATFLAKKMFILDKDTLGPFSILQLILGVLIILVNLFLVHALRKLGKLNTVSHKFIFVLSVSDICIGVALVSGTPLYLMLNGKVYSLVYIFHNIVLYLFSQFSFFMVIMIAIDRYIHMRFLTRYATIMTNRRGVKVVIGVLIATILMNAVLICGDIFGFAGLAKILFYWVNGVFLSILFIKYARAYKALRSRVNGIFLESERAATVNAARQRAPKKKFAKAVFLIFSSALICYVPVFVYVNIIYMKPSLMSVHIYVACLNLVAVNSLLNAIIFMALNNDIKRYMLQCVRNCFTNGS